MTDISKLSIGVSLASMLTDTPMTPDEVQQLGTQERVELSRILARKILDRIPVDYSGKFGKYNVGVVDQIWSCDCVDGHNVMRPCGHWLMTTAVEAQREFSASNGRRPQRRRM